MATLNTAIRGAQIEESTITYEHLDTINTPSGTYILSWDGTNNKFRWSEPGGLTVNEIPSGSINGTNKTFTLSESPITDTEQIYLNGLLQKPGASNDYTISDTTITFIDAPQTGDIILVSYLTSQLFDFESGGGRSSLTNAPYGYSTGGDTGVNLSTIDRITFPFDSGTASHVGNLSGSRYASAGCNSSNYGYNMGGSIGIWDSPNYVSTIDRITFPFDSGTASHVGNLSLALKFSAGCNSSNFGYNMAGTTPSLNNISSIYRLTFPFDSGTASHVGNTGSVHHVAGFNSSNYGFSCGGWNGSSNTMTIYRLTFPFDSGTASNVGNLSGGRLTLGGCNSSNHGYCIGGLNYPSLHLSTIDRILFPFDSGTATHVGNLAVNKDIAPSCNSTDYGYTLGGGSYYLGTYYSSVDRITFPFDSGTATHVGNLLQSVNYGSAIDGTDFVSLFV